MTLPPVMAAFLLLFLAVGCGEGGCGDESSSGSGQGSSGASPGGGPTAGSGDVTIPERASKDGGAKAAQGGGQDKKAAAGGWGGGAAPRLPAVEAAGFEKAVLKQPGALVMLHFPQCTNCEAALPALDSLGPKYKGKIDFYMMDTSVEENLGRLPKGFSVKSYPSFLLYRDGTAVSWRSGLPFDPPGKAGAGETPERYQERLARWFDDALARQNLGVAP